jgi:hypothetical protein
MKIELDLSEIFEDEDGERISVSMAERVEAAIVAKAEKTISTLVKETFEKELSQQISELVQSQLNTIIVDLLDQEFVPITKWGCRDEKTTLRNRICGDVEKLLSWKDGNYSSDQSMYTKVIKEVVSEKLKEFSREFTKVVDEKLVAECMQHAVYKLRKVVD